MGLGSFFKNLFGKKGLALPDKFRSALIHPMTNGLTTIKLGERLNVDTGWGAVFVVKERTTDVFPNGQHILELAMLPKTTKLLNLTKGKIKKSKDKVEVILPDRFLCDLYYVNLDLYKNLPWKSSTIYVRSKHYGLFRLKMNGFLDFRVERPADFIKLFLYEWSHIPVGKGEKYFEQLVNDEISNKLSKYESTDPNDYLNNKKMSAYLVKMLNENFNRYGANIVIVRIADIQILGKIGERIQKDRESEGIGNTGLENELKKQIDDLNNSQVNVTFEEDKVLPEGRDYLSKEEIDKQFKKGYDLKNIINEQNEELKQAELKESYQKDINAWENNEAHLITEKGREINRELANPTEEKVLVNAKSTLDVSVEKSTPSQDVKIKDNICPICGSTMLGGICLNCERNNQNKEK